MRKAPFEIPITVMIGTNENTTYQEALKWQDETSGGISVRQFPADTFYLSAFSGNRRNHYPRPSKFPEIIGD